jgi:hypothetical protein
MLYGKRQTELSHNPTQTNPTELSRNPTQTTPPHLQLLLHRRYLVLQFIELLHGSSLRAPGAGRGEAGGHWDGRRVTRRAAAALNPEQPGSQSAPANAMPPSRNGRAFGAARPQQPHPFLRLTSASWLSRSFLNFSIL